MIRACGHYDFELCLCEEKIGTARPPFFNLIVNRKSREFPANKPKSYTEAAKTARPAGDQPCPTERPPPA